MAELNPLELRDYALQQGSVTNRDDLLLEGNFAVPTETRVCAVRTLTVQYYRAGEPGGLLNTEEVVTVLEGNEQVYMAVYDSFSESGQPQDFEVGLSDLSTAQVELLQQAIALASVAQAELLEPEVKIKGFASVQESYLDHYGEDAALVASVVALAQRGEPFDQSGFGTEVQEAFFYRVPDSTLIVNRVETTDRNGVTTTYTVLDGDEPLFELGESGRIERNDLTLSQVNALQAAQREGASPLLVDESHLNDLAQGLTNDGKAQARTILSQGDAITPDMVTALNSLMAVEEDLRREDQSARSVSGEVRYPRFTVEQLNRELSPNAIARQLAAQSPVVQAQVVAETQRSVMPSVSDHMEAMTPDNLASMVYAQYYRWFQRYYNDPVEHEAGFVQAGFLVESLGNTLGSPDPMPFRVIDLATDRVVFDFTLAEGEWVERPQAPEEIEAGDQPYSEPTPDTIVISVLDESVKTRLLLGFEDPHRKANLIASTYLNETNEPTVYLESGLIVQREYNEDGSIERDLTFSRDAVSSEGNLYAIAQAFPDGGGMGLGMPLTVEWAINQEFEYLVDEYEATRERSQQQTVLEREVQAQQPTQPLTMEQPMIETKTSVYDRPQPELDAMEALAMTLLESGETLHIPTPEGPAVVSLKELGPTKLVGAKFADTTELYGQDPSEVFQNAGLFEAMHNGTLQTADRQLVRPPFFVAPEIDRETVVPVQTNGQREAVAPQVQSPVAPNIQPPTLKSKEATMTVVEAPVDLKPIRLDDMLSEFGRDAMRGITGTRNTYDPSTKVRGSEERTPGETFAKFAKGAYGIENFCQGNGVPFTGSADYLINKTALELDISPEFKAEILSGIKREECVAPVILATGDEAAAWKRVYELAPETFAAVAMTAVQETIAQDASVMAQAKSKTLEALGITLKTAEPTRDPVRLGYEPAPATPETASLMAFRDSLTASQLREWATAVQVNEPQNTDKQKWVADFTAKFQKSGYAMSDGGMSVGMAKRLTEVQQQMGPDVQQLRTEMAVTINQMLSQAPTVEGKDFKKIEAAKLGLTIKGNEGNFEVKGATGKLLMLAKEGEVTINRIPATVVSRMEGMVSMQQQMQQATVPQRTTAAPKKAPVAVER